MTIFIQSINSFELRSPEFSRSPTASRPEIFAIYTFIENFVIYVQTLNYLVLFNPLPPGFCYLPPGGGR